MQTRAIADFKEEHGLDKEAELSDELQDELSEYENEYLSDCDVLLRVELWTKNFETSEPVVFMRLSAGYTDAPYYRGQYDETIKELQMSNDEFLKTDLKALADNLFSA
jgi:hypothetical protein